MPDLPELAGRTIAITGGRGFIGTPVANVLEESGAAPLVVSHIDPEGDSSNRYPVVYADLEHQEQANEALADAEMVIHLAARAGGIQYQSATELYSANRRMTDNVIEACRVHAVRRAYLASSMVVYRPATDPLTENHPLLNREDGPNPYAWSKITDEVVSDWQTHTEVVIGRFGNVYGPGATFDPARSTVIHALIDRAARLDDGEELVVWGDGSAVRSFVYVEDAAHAVAQILARGSAGEVYNIDSGEPVTIRDLAQEITDVVNPSLRLSFDTDKPSGAPYRVGSNTKLQNLARRDRTSLRAGLKNTVDWYRATHLRS